MINYKALDLIQIYNFAFDRFTIQILFKKI